MKLIKTLAILAALATLGVASAQDQGGPPPPPGGFGQGPGGPPPMRRGGMMGGIGLLNMPAVQKELKMTDDQIEQVHKLFPPPPIQEGGGEGPPRREPPPPPYSMKTMDDKVKKILNSDQYARLQQIELQSQSPFALTRPDIQDRLSLNDDQRDAMARVLEEDRPTPPQPGEDRSQMRSQRKAHREKLTQDLLSVLTNEQRNAWKKMLGEPFKFPEPPMGDPGRPPGGGPGGPGGPPQGGPGGGFPPPGDA